MEGHLSQLSTSVLRLGLLHSANDLNVLTVAHHIIVLKKTIKRDEYENSSTQIKSKLDLLDLTIKRTQSQTYIVPT